MVAAIFKLIILLIMIGIIILVIVSILNYPENKKAACDKDCDHCLFPKQFCQELNDNESEKDGKDEGE